MFAAIFGRVNVAAQLRARGASLQRRNPLGLSAGFMVRLLACITRLLHRKHPQFLP
jgi:hypothetical protein